MSFLNYFLTHNKKTYKKPFIVQRKEQKDSLLANHFPKIYYMKRGRASAFTSKGSITLEAAIVVPIFFFAMLCLAYLLEMMALQTTIRNALYSSGREIAQQTYVSAVVSAQDVEQHIVNNVGTEKLNNSIIVGGANGIDCSASLSDLHTGVMNLSAKYEMKIPILMFQLSSISCEEKLRVKGWNGYAKGTDVSPEKRIVYITDTGLVYHESEECTYLDLSIFSVDIEQVTELRNQSGGKYYACETCGKKEAHQGFVYMTDHGIKYHTSLECSKLKRNVYAVRYDEVYGLGGCSKCVE